MRLRFTIILVLLNIAAAFYILHLEKKTAPEDPFDKAIANVLPNALTVDKITISSRGENSNETRVLERQRNRWEIVSPFRWPANDNAVQRILTQLEFLDIETTIPLDEIEKAGQSLADFGLTEPQVTLTYSGAGKETTLKIGAPTKLGSRLYILAPGGDDVLVVTRELLESIDVSLENLRSAQIFNLPIFEIRSLRIQAGEQRIVVTKTGEQWDFETPVNVPADPELVTSTLGMLTGSQAIKLIPSSEVDLARFGLTNPFMRVTLSGNDRRESLVLGAPVPNLPEGATPQRYAQLETPAADGTVFTVNAANFDWLVNATDELREHNFLLFDPAHVTALRISLSGKSLTLQKIEKSSSSDADTWQVLVTEKAGNVVSQPGDPELINQLMDRLNWLKARSFVSDAPSPANLADYGFDAPNASVTLDNGTPITLILGAVDKEDGRLIYAKRADQPYVYTVASTILGLLTANPLDYRTRLLDQQPPSAQVTSLKLTDLKNERVLLDMTVDPAKQTWPVALEGKDAAFKEGVLQLVEDVKSFRVDKYLESRFHEQEAAPWRYQLTAEILLPGGDGGKKLTRNYYFSFRLGAGSQIGGSPELGYTFTLTQAEIDTLFDLTFEQETPALPQTGEAVEQAPLDDLSAEPDPRGPDAPASEADAKTITEGKADAAK